MDFSRVLQARDLILFWLVVGAIGGGVCGGAALILSEHEPHRGVDAVAVACDSGPDDAPIMNAAAGSAVIEGCRESPDNWTPPY